MDVGFGQRSKQAKASSANMLAYVSSVRLLFAAPVSLQPQIFRGRCAYACTVMVADHRLPAGCSQGSDALRTHCSVRQASKLGAMQASGSPNNAQQQRQTAPLADAERAVISENIRTLKAAGSADKWHVIEPLLGELRSAGLINAKVYTSAIRSLGHAGQWQRACAQLAAMRQDGLQPGVHAYAAAMNALAAAREWQRALGLLEELQQAGVEPNEFVYGAAITACANGHHLKGCLDIFRTLRESPGTGPNEHMYNSALSGAGFVGDWQAAVSLLEDMRSAGLKPTDLAYRGALAACSGRSRAEPNSPSKPQPELALKLVAQMQQERVAATAPTYCAAIAALAVPGYWQQALELLKNAAHADCVTTHVANAAVNVCAISGEWEKALQIFDEMKSSSVPLDVVSHNSALKACAISARWREALNLLHDMKQAGPKCRPDLESYHSAIGACTLANRSEAADLIKDMQKHGITPDARAYVSAILGAGKAGMWPVSLQLFRQAEASGIRGHSSLYLAALTAAADAGQVTVAAQLLADMQSSDTQPGIKHYNSLLHACAVAGEYEKAVRLLQVMSVTEQNVRPDQLSWNTVLHAAAVARKPDRALQLLRDMEAEAGFEPDAFSFNAVITANEDRLDTVLELVAQMRENGVPWSFYTYRGIIQACEAAAQGEQALAYLHEMRDKQMPHDEPCCNSAIRALCASGDRATAKLLIDENRAEGRPLIKSVYEAFTAKFGQDALYTNE